LGLAFTLLTTGIFTGCNTKAMAIATNVGASQGGEVVLHEHDTRIVPLPARLDDCPPGVDCRPATPRVSSSQNVVSNVWKIALGDTYEKLTKITEEVRVALERPSTNEAGEEQHQLKRPQQRNRYRSIQNRSVTQPLSQPGSHSEVGSLPQEMSQ
jgi:hypothetical protein